MSNTLGVGIMGNGVISGTYLALAPLFRGFEVRAIADILPEASKRRSEEFGVPAQTPAELLKNSEIDLIVNLTPPAVHYSVSMDALSAGKHAYSEKPLAIALDQAKTLKKEADARGLRVGSAPDTFLGGGHQQVRKIVDSGQLGRITSGTTHVMSRGMEHWHPNPDFFFQIGGGPVLDVGPYYVNALIQLLGPVRRVTAFTGMARTERPVTAEGPYKGTVIKVGTPTTIHGVLEFHSGAIVTIGASWDVHSHGHHNIELYGTDGSIFVPDPNYFGGDIFTTDASGKRTKVELWDHPFGRPNFALDSAIPRANYRTAGLADLVRSIHEGRPARLSADLAVHAVDVMTSLLKAGETGEVLTLSTTCKRPAPLGPDEARELLRQP